MASEQSSWLHASLEEIAQDVSGTNVDDLSRCLLAQIEETDERLYALRLFCTPLLKAVHHQEGHFDQLNQQLSSLLPKHADFEQGRLPKNDKVKRDLFS